MPPLIDKNEVERDNYPDIGAYEYLSSLQEVSRTSIRGINGFPRSINGHLLAVPQ